MKFETFLEDFAWFDKSHKPGTYYLNPIKREKSYLQMQKLSAGDKMHFEEHLEDHGHDSIDADVRKYKEHFTRSKELIDFIHKCKLNRDYIAYRQFGSTIDVKKLRVGSKINHKDPITSTSLDWKIAEDFKGTKNTYRGDDGKWHSWTCRVTLHKGLPGFYTDIISSNAEHEEELLIESKPFIVTGFSYIEINSTDVLHIVDCKV